MRAVNSAVLTPAEVTYTGSVLFLSLFSVQRSHIDYFHILPLYSETVPLPEVNDFFFNLS